MERKQSNSSLLIGRKPVLDALEDELALEKVWIDKTIRGPVEKTVRNQCKSLGIPMSVVHVSKLRKMSRGNHQGLIAQIALIPYYKPVDIIQKAYEQGEAPFLLLLDGVSDVRNMGAIARSAEIFGAHGLITTLKGSASINELAMKSSAGALSTLPVCRVKSIVNTIQSLQKQGLHVAAADMHGELEADELDGANPIATLLGDEGRGVSKAALREVDSVFKIPQSGKTESLNVSVAAGITSYVIQKLRS